MSLCNLCSLVNVLNEAVNFQSSIVVDTEGTLQPTVLQLACKFHKGPHRGIRTNAFPDSDSTSFLKERQMR